MCLRITPKIVIRVSTVLTLSTSLAYASVSSGRSGVNTGSARHGVSTGSGSDRVAPAVDNKNRERRYGDPVATAPGTNSIPKLRLAKQESGRSVDNRPLSPRFAALRNRLKAGDQKALADFWKAIARDGAPIIEGVPGSDRDMLVTMLWRASEETKNVFVFRFGDVSKPMARLLDTDLWYKTFQLQNERRVII